MHVYLYMHHPDNIMLRTIPHYWIWAVHSINENKTHHTVKGGRGRVYTIVNHEH